MRLVVELSDAELHSFKEKAKSLKLSYRELIKTFVINANVSEQIAMKYKSGMGFKKIATEIGLKPSKVNYAIKKLLKNDEGLLLEHERNMKPEYMELKLKGMVARYGRNKED